MVLHSLVLKVYDAVYRTLLVKFFITLYTFATLGVPKLFASEFAFVQHRPTPFHSLLDLEASLEPELLRHNLHNSLRMSYGGQWRTFVKRMADVWKAALGSSLLLLPLSIAFLQIDRIDADLLARTLTLTTFVFAGGALTSGSVLVIISGTGKLDGYRCAKRWKVLHK
ncbi:unnamed protein product [Cyclocybe aegerita]|uniref:Uncharacterized protein n=1 Tax=Cyclocybe aegerita TaxID=1973307 RepID=A0A8S0VZX0_CYCAE|nr:unnamed protein product [Cyclocybe aegerita]